ncbi:MAG TPA: oxidoreductase [Magnetospirillaceae bacterium]|nr:oxidoreductase [Magnetospirillaceae bacterium]
MSLNVALVGYGYVGKTFHAPLIAATPGLTLHTIVSSRPDKVRADYPSVKVHPDLAAALADPAIELVVIATPNELHAPQAHRALEAGKHIVVDKPFTLTVEEAEGVIVHARNANRLLSVFHNRRWDADFLTLQRLMGEGKLGKIREFISHYDRFRPVVRDRWREWDVPGAGTWYDLAPHLIDQALVLFGQPDGISADIQKQREGAKAPDYFHAVLFYQDIRVILHSSCLVTDSRFRFAAHGTRGSLVKQGLDRQEDALKAGRTPGDSGWGEDDGAAWLTVAGEDDSPQSAPLTLDAGDYRRFYMGVRDAIAGTGANPVPGEQALKVMKLIMLGMESADAAS